MSAEPTEEPTADLRSFLAVLSRPGDVREVRIPTSRRTGSGYFDDPVALAAAVRPYDGRENVYITLNPVAPALLARAANRIKQGSRSTTSDRDVVERRWLPVDIDPQRPSDISASEAEREAALEVTRRVWTYLHELGWPEPVTTMSGNGYWLLYPVDLPNDEPSRQLVEGVLRHLAARFDTAAVSIDTSVSNASRIVALIGTQKVKGDATPDRPHRRSAILVVPSERVPVPRERLAELVPAAAERPLVVIGRDPMPAGWVGKLLDERAIAYRLSSRNDRTWYRLASCPFHPDDDQGGDCGVGEDAGGKGLGHCFHNRGAGKGWQDFKAELGLAAPAGPATSARPAAPSQASPPLEDAPLTEFASEPVRWLWDAWLPRGVVTLMDGNPGVSKSTLVADLVARITTGRGWPDGTGGDGRAARAMWITTEDDPGRVLRPRIEAAGGDAGLVRFVKGEVVFPSGAGPFTELVVRRAADAEGLALVILDPLFSHIDATVRTIADAEMRKGVMNPLTAAAEAAGVAILVVRHFSKDTTASAVNRGAGSLGGIVGAARALWTVVADPEDESGETKVVGVSKLNYARAHKALRYRVVDRVPPGWVAGSVSGIEWLGEATTSIETMLNAGPRSGEAARALEEILAAGPVAASVAENRMRARGFGVAATRGAKARLGVVARKTSMTGGWVWALPDAHAADAFENAEGDPGNALEGAEGDPPSSSTPSTALARAHTREEPSPSAPSTSSIAWKASKGSKVFALPAGAPARVEPARLTVVRGDDRHIDCADFRAHPNAHVYSGPLGRQSCAICHPEDYA